VHQAGTADVLDRIFQGMEERFVPAKASDVDADIVFVVADEGDTHSYLVAITTGPAKQAGGRRTNPK
jgi:hypothetical protein